MNLKKKYKIKSLLYESATFFFQCDKNTIQKGKKILLSKKIYGQILVKIFILNVIVQFSLYQNYKFIRVNVYTLIKSIF